MDEKVKKIPNRIIIKKRKKRIYFPYTVVSNPDSDKKELWVEDIDTPNKTARTILRKDQCHLLAYILLTPRGIRSRFHTSDSSLSQD